MRDIAERYFVVRSQVCKSRKQKSSVSSDILCAIASFTPLPISYVMREDLVFDVLQACRSTSLSWISTFCILTFCYIIKKLEVWLMKFKGFHFESKPLRFDSYMIYTQGQKWNVIECTSVWTFSLDLFCDEYTRAQVKRHWRIWDMKGYIMVKPPESI